jgi:hypothetical protein
MKKNDASKNVKTVTPEDLAKALNVKSDLRAGLAAVCRTCGLGGGAGGVVGVKNPFG